MRGMLFLALLAVQASAADLTLAFRLRWAGTPAGIPSSAVVNAHGQTLRVTRVAGLLSGFTLTRADGSTVRLDGQYGYLDFGSGRESVVITGVPAGDYTGIGFQWGLPPTINHGDPGRWGAGDPLNPLVDHLHWNWQGGYVFVAIEGRWHAGGKGANPADDRGFLYHIAGDERVIPVRFATQFSVEPDTTVEIAFDLAKILRPPQLVANGPTEASHSRPQDSMADEIGYDLARSFFWLGAAHVAPASVGLGPKPGAGTARRSGTPLGFEVPRGFPAPSLPADNPLTVEGVALGQSLFTDRRLSGNGTQSCADCHAPGRAFSDDVPLSRGADGKPGRRNAMPLFNLAWSSTFAWDGSKPRIRDQALAAMTNPLEMHADAAAVTRALAGDRRLRAGFQAAFGSPEITTERLTMALEQYLLTLVSADSKFDRAIRGEAALTAEEKEGFALFMTEYDPARGRHGADCFHCHGGPLFTDYDFKNNGLDRIAADPARGSVTGRPSDAGKFKTPSLRNVALTAPYMHDGRFATLAEVIAHYDHGVIRSATLDPNLAKHPDAGLQLTSAEQQALIAFLRTLTDSRWGGGT